MKDVNRHFLKEEYTNKYIMSEYVGIEISTQTKYMCLHVHVSGCYEDTVFLNCMT